jgi:hypothetical protein
MRIERGERLRDLVRQIDGDEKSLGAHSLPSSRAKAEGSRRESSKITSARSLGSAFLCAG